MKRAIIIIASVLFGLLFYDKQIGLNLLIFSIITLIVLIIHDSKKFKERNVLISAIVYICTGVIVFINLSNLSIIANCIAFFTLIGVNSKSNTSIYINWLNGVYSTIAGIFHRNVDVNEAQQQITLKKDIDIFHWVKLLGIPIAFIILFVMLYKNGNPMFNDLINKINLDFINLEWILFCVLGYFLFSNISKPVCVEPATSLDLNTDNILVKSKNFSEETLKKETQLGTLLIALLNLLIVFYIVTDILYLLTNDLNSASALSNQVHSGINTLIASIIIAIIIILYFFRGDLNFYLKNTTLKNLTYLWIILNIVLIVLIANKNHTYITSFGLTYKRIGVNVYIFLTLIGLITTLLKVMNIKSLVYLLRVNTQLSFAIVIILSTINWDNTITNYNLYKAESFDIDYLIKLSDRNAITLYNAKANIIISEDNKGRIDQKYLNHIKSLNNKDWQEVHYEYFTVTEKTNAYESSK
ncbi:DUF4153 domain-containing protein [Ichthyenterobacterium sp. W332]|uniref:DUF4153 domain-containing protein n=1 Tax=Microcosmobacter mediterraneus TaxID=3075607 RepID=A0ABU2YM21_9FLAO|nr:DUF4153 domain-containing protein [Ichthyenterobacterium sp. W332]MDT0559206.1 DUF4153 domain-containing protein [Ichthyenterobacterium sp. W332]